MESAVIFKPASGCQSLRSLVYRNLQAHRSHRSALAAATASTLAAMRSTLCASMPLSVIVLACGVWY
jgi:hypothetical protein